MKVLFVSPEVAPIARAGGLGDVVGALPIALQSLGIDVRILCPNYKNSKICPAKKMGNNFKIKLGNKAHLFQFLKTSLGQSKIPVYLLDNDYFYKRNGFYSDKNGDYNDNSIRSFALCKAALELKNQVRWNPQIYHSHDWMAASVSAYLNSEKEKNNDYINCRSILTIHNLEHQGVFDNNFYTFSGLPDNFFGIDGFNHHNRLNLLKGGIQHSDKITTVSPSYSKEIRTEEFSFGLEESLKYRAADIIGILNGIDENSWNPEKDQNLHHKISIHLPSEGKRGNKEKLLREMKLPISNGVPLFGVVSRLYHQKGLDLLSEIIPNLVNSYQCKFIILGSGDPHLEKKFTSLSQRFPEHVGTVIGFDDGLARRIFAGTDFFIMPSRFEPCGLAQQYAMKYGSIPIARNTGGLKDTVKCFTENEKSANGFLFEKPNISELSEVIHKAILLRKEEIKFKNVRKNALFSNFSWENSAKKYAQVYHWALNC